MTHPDIEELPALGVGLIGDIGQQSATRGPSNLCIAKLGCVRPLHRTAQLRGHRLHAVTNAEQGHVKTENKVWGTRRAGIRY